jgi:hypothetical protein
MMHNFLSSDKLVLDELKFLRHFVQCHSGLISANYCKLSNISSIIKSRRVEWIGHVARIEQKKHTSGIYFRKPEGKRNLGKLIGSWKGNIKMLMKETW